VSSFITFFQNALPQLLKGTVVTLELTAVGIGMGLLLGLWAALARVYGGKWVRWTAIAYIELFRGTPILVQLFLVYYGLPGIGITLDRMTSAFLALGLNSGAYQAEYLRGALMAVGEEQMIAGRAVGLSKWKTIRYVILPQAMRLVIPSWANEPVALLKSTAVAFLIAVPDLMTKAKAIAVQTYDPIGSYLAAAILYLIMVFLLDQFLKWLERTIRIPGFELEGKKA
jgi:polar amino acid transport system permease protein